MSIGCADLQPGTNRIEIGIYEKSIWLQNVYDVFKDTIITEFRFFDDALRNPSTYVLTLE